MTLHKLSAGSGYEDLTRQVAALDSTEKGATPLADYYAAKGRRRADGSAPGWSALPGVAAGDVVTAERMKHRRAARKSKRPGPWARKRSRSFRHLRREGDWHAATASATAASNDE